MKNKFKLLPAFLPLCLSACLALTACQENKQGTVDLSDYVKPVKIDSIHFSHPCALYTDADFQRVKTALEAGTAPAEVKDEFEALKANKYTMGSYGVTVHAHEQIVRGDPKGTIEGVENYGDAMRDATAAYQFALLWKLTGDNTYADKSITILEGWRKTCTVITANDANHFLAAGAQGFTFALAGELMRDYNAWSKESFQAFQQWMLDVFAAKNKEFLTKHANTQCGSGHYWSNWDLVNMCSYFQIGILTDDKDMVLYIVNYFLTNGTGNGRLKRLCLNAHMDPLGTGETIMQAQESGRDQGHATMSCAVAIQLCQAAYALYLSNPTIDALNFYKQEDYAILHMAEYIALTNLRQGDDKDNTTGAWLLPNEKIPFETVGPWCTGDDNHEAAHAHTAFSETGRGTVRPCWEMLLRYCKQHNLSGYAYTDKIATKLRPEKGAGDTDRYGDNSGAFDQVGWSTLMCYE